MSAVIDKLRLQHNTEPDLFQNGSEKFLECLLSAGFYCAIHFRSQICKRCFLQEGAGRELSVFFFVKPKLTFLFAQGTFLEDFVDENDSPRNSKVNDVADVISFDQMNSGNNSPGDPFGQGLENLPCQSA